MNQLFHGEGIRTDIGYLFGIQYVGNPQPIIFAQSHDIRFGGNVIQSTPDNVVGLGFNSAQKILLAFDEHDLGRLVRGIEGVAQLTGHFEIAPALGVSGGLSDLPQQ